MSKMICVLALRSEFFVVQETVHVKACTLDMGAVEALDCHDSVRFVWIVSIFFIDERR